MGYLTSLCLSLLICEMGSNILGCITSWRFNDYVPLGIIPIKLLSLLFVGRRGEGVFVIAIALVFVVFLLCESLPNPWYMSSGSLSIETFEDN